MTRDRGKWQKGRKNRESERQTEREREERMNSFIPWSEPMEEET